MQTAEPLPAENNRMVSDVFVSWYYKVIPGQRNTTVPESFFKDFFRAIENSGFPCTLKGCSFNNRESLMNTENLARKLGMEQKTYCSADGGDRKSVV